MFLYALALILEFAALVWLRIKQPDMPRPYKASFGTAGVVAISVPPIALCLLSMVLANNATKLVSVVGIVIGLIVYWVWWKRSSKGDTHLQLEGDLGLY